MIDTLTISNLCKYLMANSCAVPKDGLFYGKAGLSLSLFESARYFKDKKMEEYAFFLIQEALINDSVDISFDEGLCGIGFTLHFLIKNDFIEANFKELFESQNNIILNRVKTIILNNNESEILKNMGCLYYLYCCNDRNDNLYRQFHRSTIKAIRNSIRGMAMSAKSIFFKMALLEEFCKMSLFCKDINEMGDILSDYILLYHNNRATSNLVIAIVLYKYGISHHISEMKDLGLHIINNVVNIKEYNLYSMSNKIDSLLFLFREGFINENEIFQAFSKPADIEKYLYNNIRYESISMPFCYKYGVAKYVLFFLYLLSTDSQKKHFFFI